MKIYKNIFSEIISLENLFSAWSEFKKDKANKPDVLEFELNLEKNIFQLHHELENREYKHGPYKKFYISDPKQRRIHKASARDRVLHHAVFKILNPIFEKTFIDTSFSCRVGYGNHKGVKVLENALRKTNKNGTQPCFALKCDVKKFFDSVDHEILLAIIRKKIKDENAMRLLENIIESYNTPPTRERERERE